MNACEDDNVKHLNYNKIVLIKVIRPFSKINLIINLAFLQMYYLGLTKFNVTFILLKQNENL